MGFDAYLDPSGRGRIQIAAELPSIGFRITPEILSSFAGIGSALGNVLSVAVVVLS